jgi:FtsZ-interacting cell division protein ZipA
MSELHISLAIAGILVLIGVYAYNRYQERKFRRQAEQDFDGGAQDILLDEASEEAPHEGRREPSMDMAGATLEEVADDTSLRKNEILHFSEDDIPHSETASSAPLAPPASPDVPPPALSLLDEVVDFVAVMVPADSLVADTLPAIEETFDGYPLAARFLGQNTQTGALEPVVGGKHRYAKLLLALQLVSRNGPVGETDLEDFCARARKLADGLSVTLELPDRNEALKRAAMLDEFCAMVDVLIGVNVVTSGGEAIAATKVRALAESAGMKLKADGSFHYANDDGVTLFTLTNFAPKPFTPETIRQMTTHGVTLLLDVPRTPNGARVFDQMLVLARQMTGALGGRLVDDNRRPLTDDGIARIKAQLATIYAKMDAANLSAGGERALRLFS